MQVVWQVAIETHIISPVHWKAFMNAFVNLIAFLFLLNPANKSDKKKCPEIGCHSLSDTRSLGNWKQTLWSTFRTASLTLLANKAWGVYFQFWGHTVVARLSNWFLVLVFIWSFPVKEVQFAFRDSLLNWISAVIDFSLMWFYFWFLSGSKESITLFAQRAKEKEFFSWSHC